MQFNWGRRGTDWKAIKDHTEPIGDEKKTMEISRDREDWTLRTDAGMAAKMTTLDTAARAEVSPPDLKA